MDIASESAAMKMKCRERLNSICKYEKEEMKRTHLLPMARNEQAMVAKTLEAGESPALCHRYATELM